MKLLVLCDASGLNAGSGLYSALGAYFQDRGQTTQWSGPGLAPLADSALAKEPTLVIDCLGADGNPSAWLGNGPFEHLAAHANAHEWVWLLLSDSRVFPASGKRRYAEGDDPAPAVPVGERLLARERDIAANIARYLVLRTGPLIDSRGDNLLTRLLEQFRNGAVAVPESHRFCPTPADDVVRVVGAMHDQLDCGAACWGVYHYESADPVTGYEFAEVVLAAATQYWRLAESAVQLHSVGSESAEAMFPLLDCQRIRDTFGIQQLPWRRAIPTLMKRIHALYSNAAMPQ